MEPFIVIKNHVKRKHILNVPLKTNGISSGRHIRPIVQSVRNRKYCQFSRGLNQIPELLANARGIYIYLQAI